MGWGGGGDGFNLAHNPTQLSHHAGDMHSLRAKSTFWETGGLMGGGGGGGGAYRHGSGGGWESRPRCYTLRSQKVCEWIKEVVRRREGCTDNLVVIANLMIPSLQPQSSNSKRLALCLNGSHSRAHREVQWQLDDHVSYGTPDAMTTVACSTSSSGSPESSTLNHAASDSKC